MAGQLQPSSVGLTFVTEAGAGVLVEMHLARYSSHGRLWRRTDCSLTDGDAVHLVSGQRKVTILEGAASVDAVWRTAGSQQIVTVSLVNRAIRSDSGGVAGEDCLLQTRMRCSPDSGYLHPYPTADLLTADPEEEELNLLYRNVPTFALGHGAAAQWDLTSGSEPSWAETAFIPRAVVPGVQFERSDVGEVLGLGFLAGSKNGRLRPSRYFVASSRNTAGGIWPW